MRLARFTHGGQTSIGIVENGFAIDCGELTPDPPGIAALMQLSSDARAELRHAARGRGHQHPLAEVTLLAPISRPGKFLCVGLNYLDHIEETGAKRPVLPTIFNKQSTCVIGPGAPIHKPRASEQVDYEGELGMVIGRRCRHVPKERAADVIGGFLIVNDVSARDWQAHSPTWTMGKSFDTHGPTGPWVVTADEIGDPHRLDIRTWVNGELRQNSNTRQLLFNCYDLVEYLSTVFTLEPGDIIATGTPGGVGFKMVPPRYLAEGDTVRIEIQDIGELQNTVGAEPTGNAIID
jgi:2-keto-4-pentenoate hydratase/2-oxohepta-3-ene-1,7-dioic acid hydratase in catechol pathway